MTNGNPSTHDDDPAAVEHHAAASLEPAIVILNPASGQGRGRRQKDKLVAALNAAGFAHDLVETTRAGEGIELAQKAYEDGYQTFVAVGGDGTVSEVVNGLAQITPDDRPAGKVAVLSVGSGNDFANAWNISQNPVVAAQSIVRGITHSCDLGHVRIKAGGKTIERYFNNNFGTGLDSQVTLQSQKLKRLQGVLLYGTAAVLALWKLKTPMVNLRWQDADGDQQTRTVPISLVSVGNTPRSGGGFQLTPGAQMDDGLLDLGIAEALSRWQLLQLLPKALNGAHIGHPAFTLARFSNMQMTTEEPMAVEMDGEVVTEDAEEIEISVRPGRLQLLI